MTLTIKIPPVRQQEALPPPPPQSPSANLSMEDDPPTKPQRTRKRSKRYLEAQADSLEIQEPEWKIARTSSSEKTRRAVSAPPSDSEMASARTEGEVDVINAVNDQPEESDARLSESPAQKKKISARKPSKTAKSKGKAPAASARKKRNVVVSDSEDEEDEYTEAALDVVAEDEDDEDYYSPEEKPVKASKSSVTKSAASQGSKRKARAEPSETGHSGSEKKQSSSLAPSKKKARLPPKTDEAMVDIVGDSAPEVPINVELSSPATARQDTPPAAVLKKQKLPTIKKTKLAASTGVSTPVSATSSTSKPTLELGLTSNKLNHGEIRQTMINQTDLDLNNKTVYQELFLKMAGDGGTPRRTKEEERRKELNRLRDEAKAKRQEEARHSFDLQAQYDKISRFEEKLREERSSALWPNFLGAKWRQEYEREKRRQKEQQWQETVYDTREEGEVS